MFVYEYFLIFVSFFTLPIFSGSSKDFSTELEVAVSKNDFKTVEQFLNLNAKKNEIQKREWKIACIAAKQGNLNITEYISERNLSILQREDENGYTIGHIAAEYGHTNIVQFWLSKANSSREQIESLFYIAAKKGYLNVMKYLEKSFRHYMYGLEESIVKLAANNGHLDVACFVTTTKLHYFGDCVELQNSIRTAFEKSQKRDNETLELVVKLALRWDKFSSGPNIINLIDKNKDGKIIQHLAQKACTHFSMDQLSMECAFQQNLVDQKFLECLEGNGTLHKKMGYEEDTIGHIAIRFNRLDVLRFIAKKNTSILVDINNFGERVFQIAAAKGYTCIVRQVIRNESMSMVTKDWYRYDPWYPPKTTIFNWAVKKNLMDMGTLKYLVEKKKVPLTKTDPEHNDTVAHTAARDGKMEILQYLVEKEPTILKIGNYWGNTVLHDLAFRVRLTIDQLKFFVANGAPLCAKNNENNTVAHILAQKTESANLLEYLVEKEPSILTIAGFDDNTVLHNLGYSSTLGMDTLKFFLGKGAPLCATNKKKDTLAHILAHKNGYTNLLEYVVEKEPSILKIAGFNNNTILHIIAEKFELSVNTLKYLVAKGAPLTARNSENNTVVHILAKRGYADFVEYLAEKEPSVLTVVNEDGDTVLHLLARNNTLSVKSLDFLVKKGASLNKENKKAESIAIIVAGTENLELFKYLWENDPSLLTEKCRVKICELAVKSGHSSILKFIAEKEPVFLSNRTDILFNLRNVSQVKDILVYLREMCESKIPNWNSQSFESEVLRKVIEYDNANILKFMKFDVNAVHERGEPLIFTAIRQKRPNIFKYLAVRVKGRANLTALDNEGNNILFIAAKNRELDKMKYILDKLKVPINIEWRNFMGDTLLHVAVHEALNQKFQAYDISVIKYLVEQKRANINALGHENKTVLHWATSCANYYISNYLLDHGADPKLQDSSGHNFWQFVRFPTGKSSYN